MAAKENHKEGTRFERFIQKVEISGNKLPHPWIFFVYFSIIVLVLAHFLNGTTFKIPGKEEETVITSLLNADGFRYMLSSMVSNFTNFPPIGLVLPIAIAVGIGEQAGLFESLAIKALKSVPKSWMTAIFIFIAINSSLASDARYAIIIPVGATLYLACGRNPLIGIIAGYAGCSAGLSACLVVNVQDAALAGLTQSAAQLLPITQDLPVNPANNWYFMIASTFVLTAVGTFVTEKIVAPMLEKHYIAPEGDAMLADITPDQNRGLRFAGIALLACIAVTLLLTVPHGALLRDPQADVILPKSPFISGLVPIVMIYFLVVGVAYGFGARKMKNSYDIAGAMVKGCSTMSSFLVVCFFCAQFMAYFNKTNLSTYCAVKGAELLESVNLKGVPLLVVVILVTSIINIFVGSSTAKWAMLAVVMVPMLGLLGFTPSFTQAIYRVGDSVTNTITPLSYYYPFIIGLMQKYKKDVGIGTVIAYQLPYAVCFLIIWTALLVFWFVCDIPLGPGISALI